MNRHWPRWIFASASKHFADALTVESIPLFVEGDERDTADLPIVCEFRQDGPWVQEVSNGVFHCTVEINMLVSVMFSDNSYKIHEMTGLLASLFTEICVKKYGDGVDDTGDFVGSLILKDTLPEPVVITNFGRVRTDVRMMQATVEGHYKMVLSGDA